MCSEVKKKKGVALIYDPHNLYQFIWYYCTYGKEYDWIALCLPNGYKGEYMSVFCEKSGIFERIIRDEQDYLAMPLKERLNVFLDMFVHAIIGKRESYCKKILGKFVRDDEYDCAVVLTDAGIISGAFIALGTEKKIVILEDGTGDYEPRPKGYILKHFFSIDEWQHFLLAKLGYSCPGHMYSLRTTRLCEKFSSHPEQMIYRDYKTMNLLLDLKNTDIRLFKELSKKIYSEIEKCNYQEAEAIIFTDRLFDFSEKPERYIKVFQEYINQNYKSIILKRHPRDEVEYIFDKDVEVQEIDNSIPAEVVLPFLEDNDILFMYPSSIILYMKSYGYKSSYLYFKGLYNDNRSGNAWGRYMTKDEMRAYLNRFDVENIDLIEI